MKVTVINRAAETRAWGHGLHGPRDFLRTVEIADACPICGSARGTPVERSFMEDGESYSVDCWENSCGHIDAYVDVLKEAASV